MEKVSVCIPAYNEEKRIRRCLESVSAQQGIEITEILVGINSSTDRTKEFVEAHAKADPRVRVVDSPKGKPSAWNALNAAAVNDRRIFQDGDCVALPGSYARLVQVLDGHDIVGASLQRDVRGKGLVVRILNFPRRYTSVCRALNGNLYAMSYAKVAICLCRKFGEAIMPIDIINDDAFLGGVCDDVILAQDIFVGIEPVDTVSEEIVRDARMDQGDRILRQRYPELFKTSCQDKLWTGLLDIFVLFRYATPAEKLALCFVAPVKAVLYRYIHYKARQIALKGPVKWK